MITAIILGFTEAHHITSISSRRFPKYIPIAFHHLNYDSHLFIRQLSKKFQADDIGLIAENKEKYISFIVKIPVQFTGVSDKDGRPVMKMELRFIDSSRFMTSRWFYQEEDVFNLMRRIGVYPYEYIDSWERLEETRLPAKGSFLQQTQRGGCE